MKTMLNLVILAICFISGCAMFNQQPQHQVKTSPVAVPVKDTYSISDITSDWNVMASDGNLAPEVTFTITNTNNYNLDNVYIEVHFLNAKTNQDYGYQNDDISILKESFKKENIVLNGAASGLMLNSGTQVKAVIEIRTDNNDLKTVKTVMLPKFP